MVHRARKNSPDEAFCVVFQTEKRQAEGRGDRRGNHDDWSEDRAKAKRLLWEGG